MVADSLVVSEDFSEVIVTKLEVEDGIEELSVTDGVSENSEDSEDVKVTVGSPERVAVVLRLEVPVGSVGDWVGTSLVMSVGSEVSSEVTVGVSSGVEDGGSAVDSGLEMAPVPWRLTRAYRSWTTGASTASLTTRLMTWRSSRL